MSNIASPTLAEIHAGLAPLRLGVTGSEVHGAITGYLCGGATAAGDDWLAALHLEGDEAAGGAAAAQAGSALAALARASREALQTPGHALLMLLPDDDAGLEARALALVDWCRGFLGGFGLAGVDGAALEPGLASILGDLADIATTVPEPGDASEDNAALAELLEHVRFGVRLLHERLGQTGGDGKP